MIAIVNYGLGNLGSVQNMLKRAGHESRIISQPNELIGVEKLILPGVGAFDTGMKHLKQNGWIQPLNEAVLDRKVPVLGICLGMQLMTESSEEGIEKGLGWIKGTTKRFPQSVGRIPHMGWNIGVLSRSSKLLPDNGQEHRYYFVHSFYVSLEDAKDELIITNYGSPFTAGFEKANIIGVQFHPEKSHKFGLELLKNFAEKY